MFSLAGDDDHLCSFMFQVMFIVTDSVITEQEQKRYGIISGHETMMHF